MSSCDHQIYTRDTFTASHHKIPQQSQKQCSMEACCNIPWAACMYVCMDGWMDGCMDGWMDVRMYVCTYVRMYVGT